MAMNKKEQAELDAAHKAAKVARALRWSDRKPAPMIPPPSTSAPGLGSYTNGWLFNLNRLISGSYFDKNCVYKAASSCISHFLDEHIPPGGKPRNVGTQRSVALYATRLDALLALRAEVERVIAEKLAAIDEMIEKEDGGGA